jgi:hypothetical protein
MVHHMGTLEFLSHTIHHPITMAIHLILVCTLRLLLMAGHRLLLVPQPQHSAPQPQGTMEILVLLPLVSDMMVM